MTAEPVFVLVHSPLVGPYSWALVADALRARGRLVVVPPIRSLDQEGPPFWERHVEAVGRTVESTHPDRVVLVGHSGAGRILPLCGQRIPADISAYVFVDSDIPAKPESRLDGMPDDVAQQFRDAAQDELLLPWPEEVFKPEIEDESVRNRLVSELSPLPLAVYQEAIPLPEEWPDAPCAYIRLSHRYPHSLDRAQQEGWAVRSFEGDHFFILVDPHAVASALIDIVSKPP